MWIFSQFRTGFLCSLQKSISKLNIQFVKLDFSKIKYRWMRRVRPKNNDNNLSMVQMRPAQKSNWPALRISTPLPDPVGTFEKVALSE